MMSKTPRDFKEEYDSLQRRRLIIENIMDKTRERLEEYVEQASTQRETGEPDPKLIAAIIALTWQGRVMVAALNKLGERAEALANEIKNTRPIDPSELDVPDCWPPTGHEDA